jgi:hypothetical protein
MKTWAGVVVGAIVAASVANAQSLQEQSACAQQAQKVFNEYNNAGMPPGYKLVTSDHQSHYNAKLGKCVVLITTMFEINGKMFLSSELLDAFERYQFANYLSTEQSFQRPSTCTLARTIKDTANCSSRAEFDAFVSGYLEQ